MRRFSVCGAGLGFLVALALGPATAVAQQAQEPVRVDLAAGRLADAITELSVQTGVQILAPSALVEGEQTSGLRGTYTAEQALGRLVEPLGLEVQRSGPRSLTLAAPPQPTSRTAAPIEELIVQGSYTRRQANSATGLNMSLRETPQSITVISQERMADQNLNEISQVLDQAVGVTYDGTTLGSDGDKFYGRGFAVSNYQIDGVPRPSGMYGFRVSTSDMILYDRVEIVRGATGLMNGVGSPAASINMIRRRPSEELTGGVSLQAGSWSRQRLGFDVSGALTDAGGVRGLVAASYEDSDSYIDRIHLDKYAVGGIIEADLTDRTLLSAGIEYQDFRNEQAPRGGVGLFFTDGTLANFPRSTNVSAVWGDLANSRLSLFAELEQQLGDRWLVRVNVDHDEPEYDEIMGYLGGGPVDPQTGEGDLLYSARWAGELEQDFIGAYFQGTFSWLGRDHEVVFGVNDATSSDHGLNYCGWWCGDAYSQPVGNVFAFVGDGQSTVTMPDLGPSGGRFGGEITQRSAYSAVRLKPAERLALVFGGRFSDWKEVEYNESDAGVRTYGPPNEEEGVFTPYFGLVVELTGGLSAYASYTQIFEPQNYETVAGDKLDPQDGTNYEAGLKAEFFDGRLSASFGAFRVEQDNFAVWIPDVFTPDGDSAYRSEDGTVSKGFELEIAGELLPGWQMVGGFSRSEPKDALGERLMLEIPAETFKLFSSYAFSGRLQRLTVGGNLRWQSETRAVGAGPNGEDFVQGSLVLLDLMAKYRLSSRMSMQINANNVLDKNYRTSLGWSANFGEPRNVAASLRWTF